MRPILAALVLALAALPAAAQRTIRVPSEAPTIQAGIDMARDGDTVLLAFFDFLAFQNAFAAGCP